LALLENSVVDLVVQDMNFAADTTSGEEGTALFKEIRRRHPDLPVILLTAWTHLDAAVQLIKAGAADYLAKPWDDRRLTAAVQNLIELGQANRELQRHAQRNRKRKHELEQQYDLRGVIWNDPATERVLSLACQVARADVPVLITGANGTGKERIAEIIQANSSVKGGPFVTLNCGALPSELIEAELFGADIGAYTGASKAREGKFEAADGGTLFLDEIGNLPPAGQMKLLRVLDAIPGSAGGNIGSRDLQVAIVDQRLLDQRLQPRVAEDLLVSDGGKRGFVLAQIGIAGRPRRRNRRRGLEIGRLHRRAAACEDGKECRRPLHNAWAFRWRRRSRSAANPSRTPRRTSTKKSGI